MFNLGYPSKCSMVSVGVLSFVLDYNYCYGQFVVL